MSYDPLVTVVISVYNKEDYVAQAIESVMTQTYRNLDIIVVDDGSTDSSRDVIQVYLERDSRLRYYNQPNSGVASCRNRGLTDSDGKYIVFLDGDDYLYQNYIETAVRYMEINLYVDLLHVAWDNVDQDGKFLSLSSVRDQDDYLQTLLLANMFALHAVFCRMSFLRKKVGLFNFYTVTDDWEYWIRCAKEGGYFKALNKRLVAYRVHGGNNKRVKAKQRLRFFPIIEKVFDPAFGLPEQYRALEPVSRVRHHFFLLENYVQWGWWNEVREQFDKALALIRSHPIDWKQYSFVLPLLSFPQLRRLSLALARRGAYKQILGISLWRILILGPMRRIAHTTKLTIKRVAGAVLRIPKRVESRVQRSPRLLRVSGDMPYAFDQSTTIDDIKRLTLAYLDRQRVLRGGEFAGYRHSDSTSKPVLYATLFSLLTKHLYGVHDEWIDAELELVLSFQDEDGLFRDPVIACPQADGMYHGWGWRHLTLHALMTLALYDTPEPKEMRLVEPYDHLDRFRRFLESREWTGQAASTGNELQNIGVMLQYARDYQNSTLAGSLIEIMYEVVDSHQDPQTGLYGDSFQTPQQLSWGVISAYHLWLLYFYDRRPIPRQERIIDSLLVTQNTLGGYGVRWNSSACEDIDSIDPLARFSQLTDYRRDDVQASLQHALPALLHNLNGDGGWVYRRHEANMVIHPQMFSAADESDTWYTWYRTLAFAYLLTALDDVPPQFVYPWQFKRAPGHQFPLR